MPSAFESSKEFILGRKGELAIRVLLQDLGWYVIPSADYNKDDKAPRLQGKGEALVIPDLDISRNGDRKWAEVKTKTEPTFYRKLQRYEHGIPLRHLNHYLKIQQITGTNIALFVYEVRSSKILFQTLNKLNIVKRLYYGDKMSYGGMAFFPRDCFEEWGHIIFDAQEKPSVIAYQEQLPLF